MGYLTPVNPPSHQTVTRRIVLPADASWTSVFDGMLLDLSFAFNWEEFGDLTPAEAAQWFADHYEQFTRDDTETPYSDNADELDGVPDYPWYEQVYDWIIAGFLAVSFTPQASIIYRATVPKIRIAFRTGDIGALFRVLINSVEVWSGDSQAATTNVLAQEFDCSTLPTPYEVKIIHNGKGPNVVGDSAKLEYIRDDNQGGAQLPQTLVEYDDNCGLKWSYDDGATWTNVDLASCADREIVDKISFRVHEGQLQVSLNDQFSWENIYNAPDLADTEILNKILFGQSGTALTVSLDGGSEYGEIYDAAPIADTEILNMITFQQDGLLLKNSLNGGSEIGTIYDPTDDINAAIEAYTNSPDQKAPYVHTQPNPYGTLPETTLWSRHITMMGATEFLIPFPIASGMTINVTNIQGITSPDGIAWRGGDGNLYALGAFTGPKTYSGNRRNTTAALQALILYSSGGSIQADLSIGQIAIPEGKGATDCWIQVNYTTLSSIQGSLEFDIEIYNGVSYATVEFDFVANGQQGFTDTRGTWTPGVGFVSAAGTLSLHKDLTGYTLVQLNLYYTVTGGSINNLSINIQENGIGLSYATYGGKPIGSYNQPQGFSVTDPFFLDILIDRNGGTGGITVTKCVFTYVTGA